MHCSERGWSVVEGFKSVCVCVCVHCTIADGRWSSKAFANMLNFLFTDLSILDFFSSHFWGSEGVGGVSKCNRGKKRKACGVLLK